MGVSQKEFTVYILECNDGSFYTGMTDALEKRIEEHQMGLDPKAYTFSRRPIKLVWSQSLSTEHEAFEAERQIKGWSRAKKEALICGDWERIHGIVAAERKRRERDDL